MLPTKKGLESGEVIDNDDNNGTDKDESYLILKSRQVLCNKLIFLE